MDAQASPPPERLDSWKAIADYLGRDVATVRRWERLHRLPVRRIDAGRGRSVFAYVSEIDAWLRAMPSGAAPSETGELGPVEPDTAESESPRVMAPHLRWAWPVAAAAVIAASVLFWNSSLLHSDAPPFRARFTSTGIEALDQAGRAQWLYPFPAGDRLVPPAPYADIQILGGANPGVLAATSHHEQASDRSLRSGQLWWLTPRGDLARAFSFGDQVTFGGVSYTEPWMLDDFSVDERGGARRIAVAAHHQRWWPSLVTVLDEQWQRRGTFVNAGWVNEVHWLSADQLLISGFANAFSGGMVGILDVRALDAQAPPGDDPHFQCPGCGSGRPQRYVVLPRSEVNEASGAALNGALVQMQGDQIVVRTIEVDRIAEAVEAIYEFSPSLELRRASYGDRYWEMHKTLEAEGKINHPRERCPSRNGPTGMKVWEQASGWTPLTAAPGARNQGSE